ncbi:energy-coupling factor transporter transmembrane protein EcfT [Labedella phragmitis]|uniref:Energy-coupling factor transporter transmembrane protein EcfT n=1 Tax=Labedella phragmitis TaxID=2498849 RepID=A0A3S3Z3F1_9MICO|nr:energy-coupling factor transporter transmembrane component T [Labedella phragmitis]RWZ50904.1 energy-coupling factor transporter transmembrane protein EcfT [Labedella phragmitis]
MSSLGVPRPGYLHGLNPLTKIAVVIPAMAAVIVSREPVIPLALLALALVTVFTGTRLPARTVVLLLVALPVGVAIGAIGFGLWTDPARVDRAMVLLQVGDYRLYVGSLVAGLTASLRLAALLMLALVSGLTTSGPDFVRSVVQHLRVPYRIGYTALAAFRFIPRFRHDLDLIRQAHRVRGTGGRRGPLAAIGRLAGAIVPLLAGAIRHAERVALAMDARAFGAHPTRTERHSVPLRRRDAVFAVVFLTASGAIVVAIVVSR